VERQILGFRREAEHRESQYTPRPLKHSALHGQRLDRCLSGLSAQLSNLTVSHVAAGTGPKLSWPQDRNKGACYSS
jgi:hypothetical protein